MASLRKQVEELQAENEDLRSVVEDYESRFDEIASSIPGDDEEEQEEAEE